MNNIKDIFQKSQEAKGKHISDYNINNRSLSKNNKGVIGQIVEEGLFGYAPNNKQEADFSEIGLELKVTGLRQKKNKTLAAKERLVLNVIDYETEQNIEFYQSSFWKKNKNLLIIFYLYDELLDNNDFLIIDSMLHNFTGEDLEVIKQDWKYIKEKIENGEAHLISEADTMYLGACTKGATASSSLRTQPFSAELAKQRAYSLKSSYITQLVLQKFSNIKVENLTKAEELRESTFQDIIKNKLQKYVGMSESEIRNVYSITTESKNKFERYIAKMLGINGRIDNTEEFKKSNSKLKTIRVNENGKIVESMSFPAFKYLDIVNEDWEESQFYQLFYETKFVFAVFHEVNGDYYFKGVIFWNMPMSILDNDVRRVWEQTRHLIKTGNIVRSVNSKGVRKTNFSNKKSTKYIHIRPHGRNSMDTYSLPVRDKATGLLEYTKHCIWINNSYVQEIIRELIT